MRADKLKSLSGVKGLTGSLNETEKLMVASIASGAIGKPAIGFIEKPGKRLRPALVLAIALNKGPADGQIIAAAAAIELLHLASIAHDALIDNDAGDRLPGGADQVSLLILGDYLIASAFSVAAKCEASVSHTLAGAVKTMAEGEATHTPRVLSPAYLSAARQKTASLFAAACRLGGIFGGFTDEEIKRLGKYGELFGTSFQIIDDVKDGDISKKNAPPAFSRIEDLNREAVQIISGIKGAFVPALQALPDDYLAWALGR